MTRSKTPGRGWARAVEALPVGTTIKDRYELDRIEEGKALVFRRLASGKEVRVTARLLDRCWAATADGGRLAKRTNGPTGISYTVAVEEAVVAALGLVLDQEGRWRRG